MFLQFFIASFIPFAFLLSAVLVPGPVFNPPIFDLGLRLGLRGTVRGLRGDGYRGGWLRWGLASEETGLTGEVTGAVLALEVFLGGLGICINVFLDFY